MRAQDARRIEKGPDAGAAVQHLLDPLNARSHDIAFDIFGKPEPMHGARRYHEKNRRTDREFIGLDAKFPRPATHGQNLKEVALMPVERDLPVEQCAADGNRFAMDP